MLDPDNPSVVAQFVHAPLFFNRVKQHAAQTEGDKQLAEAAQF